MHLEVLRAQVGNGQLLLEQREGQGRPEEAAEGAVAVQVAHLFIYVRERGYRQVAHLCIHIHVCCTLFMCWFICLSAIREDSFLEVHAIVINGNAIDVFPLL